MRERIPFRFQKNGIAGVTVFMVGFWLTENNWDFIGLDNMFDLFSPVRMNPTGKVNIPRFSDILISKLVLLYISGLMISVNPRALLPSWNSMSIKNHWGSIREKAFRFQLICSVTVSGYFGNFFMPRSKRKWNFALSTLMWLKWWKNLWKNHLLAPL